MKIAVDAMGGDHAPEEIIAGAVEASRNKLADIVLVGDNERIKRELENYSEVGNISLHPATEVVGMNESPVTAIRRKKDSSILISHKLLKDGEVSGVVSAGNTGAQMTAALLTVGRISSISRPAIATVLPSLKNPILLLDVGANVDCKPENLLEFAYMGSIYARDVLNYDSPKVGLLNIGTEETKGNILVQSAYPLLKESSLNFHGNIEARDIPNGEFDVIVCDGFIGNCILKFAEGLSDAIFSMIKEELVQNIFRKTVALGLKPGFKNIRKRLDYEEYGGAPLLGVQGTSIVCHGSSKASAIKNAIKVAVQCVEMNLVSTIAAIENRGNEER